MLILLAAVLVILIGAAAVLAARAEHWRDPHWVGLVAVLAVTVMLAFTVARMTTA